MSASSSGLRPRPTEGVAGGQALPAFLPALVLAAAATALMLEGTRVFVSYLVFVVDQSQRTQIASIALGVFLAAGLGGPLARLIGARRTVVVGALGLALARLTLQFVEAPEARLVLGAAVLIGWGWLAIGLVATRRDAAALGLAAGVALDLALRVAAHTVDLPWIPGLAADAATILLGVALVAATVALGRERWSAALSGPALPLVAVGPGLALYHLLTGNLGLAQVRTGAGFPEASAALALGAAFGLALAAAPIARRPTGLLGAGRTLLLAVLLALGNGLTWRGGMLAGLGLFLAAAAGLALLAGALAGGGRTRPAGLLGITLGFTLGLLVEMGVLFAYYTFTGRPGLIWVAIAALALFALAGDLLGAGSPGIRTAVEGQAPALAAATIVAALALGWGWATLSWAAPAAGAPLNRQLTVMTYNIQSGFDRDERWDLEATARTIEAQHPDVVVLEEVSRGWLVTSGADEALWLSHRLGMPYVFGANSEDGLWGNLVLTRAPLASVAVRRYSTTRNLERAAVEVRLATQGGDLWVLGTHLDDPVNADDVRLAQVGQLLGFWAGHRPALILGDFNDDPGTPVPDTIVKAGLSDVEAELGPGTYTSRDHRRIDYIFDTPGIAVSDVHIPDVWTSDHRPVVAQVTLQP